MITIISKDISFVSGLNIDDKVVVSDLSEFDVQEGFIVIDGKEIKPDDVFTFIMENKEVSMQIHYKVDSSVDFYYASSILKNFEFVKVYSDNIGLTKFYSSIINAYKKEKNLTISNVFCFSGATRGVGCTSIASSVSKQLSENEDFKVLHICLDGTEGFEYLLKSADSGIDSIKSKLLTGIVTTDEILDVCVEVKPNFYFLKGSALVPFVRQFTPESIEILLNEISNKFDVVVCDVGSDYTLGSTVGVMNYTPHRFIVTGQAPVPLRRFRNALHQILIPLGFQEFYTIINHYRDIDGFVKPNQISLELKSPIVAQIPFVSNAIQCEVKHQTLSEVASHVVETEISKVVEIISKIIGKEVNITSKKRGLFGAKK